MKAYVPLPHTVEPDDSTFLLEPITHYVITQVDLFELTLENAYFKIPSDPDNNTYILQYNLVLDRIPIYGTKCDCESACKMLNKGVKEKVAATMHKLSTIK